MIYINDKSNDLSSSHTNDYINNLYTKKIRENEIDKSNSFFNSNSMNDNELNYLNVLAFDEYMSKVALNKYNKIKQFNESYYIKKQNGEEDINNNISNLDDLNLMKKHLDKKYQLYNLISKYDQINYKKKGKQEREEREEEEEESNNFNRNESNKNINNENYDVNIKDISNERIRNLNIFFSI